VKGWLALAVLLLASGCHRDPAPTASVQGKSATGLEEAAIQAGVIHDPDDSDITGLYARDTDRVCVVPGATAYRIGVFVDYGDQLSCGGSGTATRVGETLHVDMDGAERCSFDAHFDGDRIAFPGRVPDACGKICSRRASIAALEVDRLSESVSEASTLRDGKGKLLCSGDN
jgi:hypothetical protein